MKNQYRAVALLGALSALLSLLMMRIDYTEGIIGLLATLGLLAYAYYINRREAEFYRSELSKFAESIDTSAKHSMQKLPLPLAVLNSVGIIQSYNERFKELCGGGNIFESNVFDYVPDLRIDFSQPGFLQSGAEVGGRVFSIYSSTVEENGDIILYFIDETDFAELQDFHKNHKPVVIHVNVDNLDEVGKDIKDDYLPFIKSEIEKVVYRWGGKYGALVKRLSADKFILISNYEALLSMEQLKFPMLDEARVIDVGNKMPITFSVGVGHESETFQGLEAEAFACLELALGRGGDQAVLRRGGNYEYYGGKTKAVEKRNKVKARVIAHGMRLLINESSNVFIMGHRFPDMDSFGACVGVFRAVRLLGGTPHIVLSGATVAIEAVYSTFEDNAEYSFVTGEEAVSMAGEDSLLVVVDTHKKSISEYPPLVDAIEKVAVIDHHRRGAEFIDKAVVKYVEPYSSSTSELVTEVIQYITDKPHLLPEEADALLAGIIVDTKNFSLRTGVRTFDAAAFLRRSSADPIKVRQLFQDNLEIFRMRASIVGSAERYRGDIAIASTNVESSDIQLIAAQAANDLLDIKGILASFVIARSDAGITFISGRSLGEVNVQIVLETIGGGGHLEVAGAQFDDKSVEEARELLKGAIDKYYSASETE